MSNLIGVSLTKAAPQYKKSHLSRLAMSQSQWYNWTTFQSHLISPLLRLFILPGIYVFLGKALWVEYCLCVSICLLGHLAEE